MIGRTVSRYRIVETLGEGGMGVVYRAQDTELNRMVAMKALPADRATDPERRARLLREAQTASALNHPNIVTIHDVLRRDEGDFIVMELVQGRSLDALIPRAGMRLGETLKVAIQVASALEAAHDAGIVHRDLKPGNVMVGDDGRVRVLDFGLAKAEIAREPSGDDDLSARETEARPATREGQIVGTVSYMSPEQAEGRPVDARSDIFSFGCVLYEMVAGRRPFTGGSTVATLAAVIKADPEPLPDDVPDELQRLIRRCLRKDPKRRLQHVVDARLALEDLKEEPDSGTLTKGIPGTAARSDLTRERLLALAAIVVVAAIATGVWLGRAGGPGEPPPPMREVPFTSDPGGEAMGHFSPDGSTVAFVRWQDDTVTGTGRLEAKVIGAEGTQVLRESGASYPVFSPDGRWIAFYAFVNGDPGGGKARIEVMPRIGGDERLVAEVRVPLLERGVSWTPDGGWLVSPDRETAEDPFHIALISAESGQKRRLTTPPPGPRDGGDRGAALSPDGRTLVFSRHTVWGESDLYVLPLDEEHRPAGEPRPLTHNVPHANGPTWTPDGLEIVFCSRVWHAATLWRVAADGQTPPRRLGLGGTGAYAPDVDPTGSKLLYNKHTWDLNIWQLGLLPSGEADGEPRPLLQSTLLDELASFSPDGEWIAFRSERSGAPDLWLADPSGGRLRQLTSLGSPWGMTPVWSPDGEWITVNASVRGQRDVYVVNAKGGAPRAVASDPADWSADWSADGKRLVYASERDGTRRLWSVPREGGSPPPSTGSRRGAWPIPRGPFATSPTRGPTGGGRSAVAVPAGARWRRSSSARALRRWR